MIKNLVHDPIFLAGKSEPATKDDLFVAQDLLDTLIAHKDSCVGMAANMTGVKKRIIAFLDESRRISTYTVMLNPEIIKKTAYTMPRKVAYLFSAAHALANAINPLRLSIKTWNCRLASRPTQAGRLRSFSTKSIIVMEF